MPFTWRDNVELSAAGSLADVGSHAYDTLRWLLGDEAERVLVLMGSLACQSGPIEWVGLHRHHHKFSDTEPDHHNSHRGFWWSHIGWMFREIPAMGAVPRLTGDLAADPYYRWLNRNFLPLQLPLALLLYEIGSVSGVGGWALVLWGIPLRLVLVYHATWLVNSATHRWGYVSHRAGDGSRNNWWVAVLTFGEGWHNNHHWYPGATRQGFFWWEVDLTFYGLWLLSRLGIIRNLHPVPARVLERS